MGKHPRASSSVAIPTRTIHYKVSMKPVPVENGSALPDSVKALIMSYTAHPAEPEFRNLAELTERSSLEQFPVMFDKDPVLVVNRAADPSLNGAWYFTAEANALGIPICPIYEARSQKVYQFEREGKKLFLMTSLKSYVPVFYDNNGAHTLTLLKLSLSGDWMVPVGICNSMLPFRVGDSTPIYNDFGNVPELTAKVMWPGHQGAEL